MKNLKNRLHNSLALLIFLSVTILSAAFIICGTPAEDGSITLDGKPAQISEAAKNFISEAEERLNRIMNEDPATDEQIEKEFDVDEVGLGFHTTIDDILARRLPDGNTDGGRGWQCSKYTAFLATGRREYSSVHPDYGPVNGKNVAQWLMDNYGFKQIAEPVPGAIGSGGFGTRYGHTVMYLGDGYVNDANYIPLTVSTHKMDLTGYIWVVPGDYEPEEKPEPVEPETEPVTVDSYTVVKGDTLGAIVRRLHWCDGCQLFGDNGYTQKLAESNGIKNRGLIYPGQVIRRK